jgi:argininosuccinate lyase
MENTGRIRKTLTPSARRIIFSSRSASDVLDELRHMSWVDLAHLVMLAECGIVEPSRCTALIAAIHRLQKQEFAPILQRSSTRGLFLLYEDYLIETEGPESGGILQTARSRNDLNATLLKRRLRQPYLHLLSQVQRLHAILLRRAEKYSAVVMPVYTHGQPAMPTTYGHYLSGIAEALFRSFEGLLSVAGELQCCPLGAGAISGTSFPIRTERTAQLLGFDSGTMHSLEAVASRDFIARLLSATSLYGLSLSRLATDFLQWTTSEFDFLHLPDELTGSSSAMPQKRNPFLLEHVQGRSAALTAAFVHAAGAMHAMPFTNSIAVGTEAVRPVWRALQDLTEMATLMRLVVGGAEPNRTAMLERAVIGFTTATAIADQLVREEKLDFRTAHRMVGVAVLKTLESSNSYSEGALVSNLAACGLPASSLDIDPASIVQSYEFGGGPGPGSLKACLSRLRTKWILFERGKHLRKTKWQDAEIALTNVVEKVLKFAIDGNSFEYSHDTQSDNHAKARTIELRSDTFTLPSKAMMAAIASAPLGDDGYREDPTVIRLEELAAEKLGKQAACLTPSGTMANLAAILTHCKKGNLALVGDQSDIYAYEDQGLAGDIGVTLVPVPTQSNGTLSLSSLENEFKKANHASLKVDLVCLENPHNLCGGVVLSLDYIREVADFVHARGAHLHLDGARLFHAAVQLKIDAAEITRSADSVQVCLSKGLAAPVGSIVAGSFDFIEQVRNKRQMLGGNMRQAGIIAAAGIVALEHMVERLADDHANAQRFAEGLTRIHGIEVDMKTVQTNTVVFRVVDSRLDVPEFIETARGFGLHVSEFKRGRLRAVFHYGIEMADVEEALRIISRVMQEPSETHLRFQVQAHS